MIEKPIIYQGHMVRSVLDETKRETRRIMKLPKPNLEFGDLIQNFHKEDEITAQFRDRNCIYDDEFSHSIRCPYGKIDDNLWVRETWEAVHPDPDYYYKSVRDVPDDCKILYRADGSYEDSRYFPSIFMRRVFSRIDLRVKNVEVQRLQDITEKEAIAEGIEGRYNHHMKREMYKDYSKNEIFNLSPITSFHTLWDSINGKDKKKCWNANPYVWVVKFRKIDK